MNKKESLLSKLFCFAGKHKYITILGMILSGISSILALLPIAFIWICVSEIFNVWPNVELAQNIVYYYAWMAFIFSILSILVYFLALICTHFSAFRIAKNIRYYTLRHLMKLPLGYFNESGSGKLRRIVDESAGQTESYLAHQLPDLVGAFVTPIAAIFFLFAFNWRLGVISIAPIAISFIFLMQMVGPGHSENISKYQSSLENMNNEAVEYIRGVPVVKIFGQSIFSFKKFYKAINQYKDFALRYTIKFRRPMIFYTVFINSISIFLVLGGAFLITISSTPKEFLTDFLFYLFFTPVCLNMMNKIMWTSKEIIIAKDALDRIDTILKAEPLKEKEVTIKPSKFDIRLENVSFAYPNTNNFALSNISLSIEQGSTVALVGPSGGGKSTAASLIARFFDAVEGSIKIGGIDIKDIAEDVLMNNISFVFQNSNLFKTSILENIRESKPNATKEEVMKAVKAARCEDIIAKLPDGIDTIVGANGVYLSGGEVQRIVLARAILKDAPIILLDEATAFADPENEYEIQLAFEELAKGKTILMIAHRLSTIQNASFIYLLSDGKIIESGKHTELLGKEGIYKGMWDEYKKAASWKIKEVCVND
ncbi:ABC transporter ATP-binding protein [Clostridioides difficile]|nr:ABC transporter ATP-binding protein [Clostridioides difficile]